MAKEIIAPNKIALFEGKKIRKLFHHDEWWFSVVDVVEALTDSQNPRDYWFKMKIRVGNDDGIELSTICRQLKLEATDGKKYTTDCVYPLYVSPSPAPAQKGRPQWSPLRWAVKGMVFLRSWRCVIFVGNELG